MLLLLCLLVLSIVMILFVIAFFIKKDVIEKVQIITSFNTLVIIFLTVFLYYINKPQYIDITLLYGILSFVGILATSKFLKNNIKNNKDK